MRDIVLTACGCAFAIGCPDHETAALVSTAFGGLLRPRRRPFSKPPAPCLAKIERAGGGGYRVDGPDVDGVLDDADGLLFHLDKLLTIALQLRRPELYFLHAAAVSLGDRAAILAAPAGAGKSTLTLSLLGQGFEYLSDELAPIDLETLAVHPYAHALCLKAAPPAPLAVPDGTLRTGARYHVPVAALPGPTRAIPMRVAAIAFVQRASTSPVVCRPITPASATARLMANVLNGAAHGGDGLEASARVAERVPGFELDSTDLGAAAAALRAVLATPSS